MQDYRRDTSMKKEISQYERISQEIKNKLAKKDTNASFLAKENKLFHETWMIEQQILSFIREGNTEGLRRLFITLNKEEYIKEQL